MCALCALDVGNLWLSRVKSLALHRARHVVVRSRSLTEMGPRAGLAWPSRVVSGLETRCRWWRPGGSWTCRAPHAFLPGLRTTTCIMLTHTLATHNMRCALPDFYSRTSVRLLRRRSTSFPLDARDAESHLVLSEREVLASRGERDASVAMCVDGNLLPRTRLPLRRSAFSPHCVYTTTVYRPRLN